MAKRRKVSKKVRIIKKLQADLDIAIKAFEKARQLLGLSYKKSSGISKSITMSLANKTRMAFREAAARLDKAKSLVSLFDQFRAGKQTLKACAA